MKKEKLKFRWWAAWIWLGYSIIDVFCKLVVILSWGKINPNMMWAIKLPSAWRHSNEYWKEGKENVKEREC